MSRFITYLKFYFRVKPSDVRELALESYRDFMKDNPKQLFDVNFCQGYQRGFLHAYRKSYALAKIENL